LAAFLSGSPVKSAAPDFDGLARAYRVLEFLAFGRALERARFCLLDRLGDCREILVLGEGDGRCLARLVRAAPGARIRCVDASGAMLARASARLADPADRDRVTFEQANALMLELPAGRYDAVVTLFFLDCFLPDQVELLVTRVRAGLRPGARWLWADFAVPPGGWRRRRAEATLRLLYLFFRWQTGLPARTLPPAEAILERTGFERETEREFQGGLVRTTLFRDRAPPR
jgi:ubiquinone/menaquinone biosynthesis C-methylase UbiE